MVQIGALLEIFDERQLRHVDVDELAPARVRLEDRGELAQRRRLVGRGERGAAIGGDRVLGVAEALPVQVAGALAQAAHGARIVDEVGFGDEHARQLAPVLLQKRERRQRRRRGQVRQVVVERDLVGGARGGALVEHDLLDLPRAVTQHRAEDDVARWYRPSTTAPRPASPSRPRRGRSRRAPRARRRWPDRSRAPPRARCARGPDRRRPAPRWWRCRAAGRRARADRRPAAARRARARERDPSAARRRRRGATSSAIQRSRTRPVPGSSCDAACSAAAAVDGSAMTDVAICAMAP